MNIIKTRILQFADLKQLNRSEFFNKIGLVKSNFSGKGAESDISSSKLFNILNFYPELNAEWLLTGKGSMIKDEIINHEDIGASTELKIGERIKSIRNKTDLKQIDLVRLLNIDQSQFSKIENDKLLPTLLQCIDLSKILNRSLDFIVLGKEENNSETHYKEMYNLAKEQIELLKENKQMLQTELNNIKSYQIPSHETNSLIAEPQPKLKRELKDQ